jgi:protein involved in polysaccharide export with SLBB domain
MMMTRCLTCCLALLLLFGAAAAQSVLKPGDVVALTCKEDPSLNGDYTVTDGGLLLLQFIGAVEVKGLSESAAAQKISKQLVDQRILRTATVTVKLKQRDRLPISFGGAVRVAGEAPYREGLKLSDILKLAVPTIAGDLDAIRITRVDGTVITAKFSGPEPYDPLLQPGDRVFVPLKAVNQQVTVVGAVKSPGVFDFKAGMKVADAIAAAGGFRSDAEKSRVAVKFAAGGNLTVDMDATPGDAALSPGDQITVPVRASTEYVYVRGAISRPGLIPYSKDMTVAKAVREAGPVEGARLDRVKIIRKSALDNSITLTANLLKIADSKAIDEPLMPGDVVDVPYPARSYSVQEGLRVLSIAVLLYLLFKK